jgi:nucleoside-diphosphate-sugar epimerase
MRFYQQVIDLTNEFDIENGIKDCDVVINFIGEKNVCKYDSQFDIPNVIIPREIAKVCAKKQKEGKVKRFIHISAAGSNPDALSRRLRSKWKGEQEVRKYFPEVTIMKPTTILSNSNYRNFTQYYLHCWNNNNGTVLLLDDGERYRQPVLDKDICMAIYNSLQMDESIGQTYELGSLQKYRIKELIEFFSNSLNHRPRFISLSYEDFMKITLSPNRYEDKAIHWLVTRPDYSAEMRIDILANKSAGVKTFEDLHIVPVAPHQVLSDWGNWFLERQTVEISETRNHDELDADDDAHH